MRRYSEAIIFKAAIKSFRRGSPTKSVAKAWWCRRCRTVPQQQVEQPFVSIQSHECSCRPQAALPPHGRSSSCWVLSLWTLKWQSFNNSRQNKPRGPGQLQTDSLFPPGSETTSNCLLSQHRALHCGHTKARHTHTSLYLHLCKDSHQHKPRSCSN